MNERQPVNTEKLLYLLIFVIGLTMRLANLGQIPLSTQEADWAYQAYQLTQGEAIQIGPNPAYVILTSFLFDVFGSSEGMARLLPAILGSVVMWLPFALRDRLGRVVSLIAALGLAVGPGMLALSRLAGGPMLAVGFAALATLAWLNGSKLWVGIWGGLALLSGPAIWGGLITLLLAIVLFQLRRKESLKISLDEWRPTLIAAGVTILVAGTFFVRYPNGLAAMASSLPAYLTGWFTPSYFSAVEIGYTLVGYQPIAFVFGLIGVVRAWREDSPTAQLLSIWAVVALGAVALYPARQASDLVWALIPLWVLAALEIRSYFHQSEVKFASVAWTMFGLTVLFGIFFWLNLAGLARQEPQQLEWRILLSNWGLFNALEPAAQQYAFRVLIATIVPLLVVLAVFLIGLGWSLEDANRGLMWGLVCCLGFYTLSTSFGASYSRIRNPNELWYPAPAAGHPDMLLDTVENLAELANGDNKTVNLVYQVDNPLLHWAFRDLDTAQYAPTLNEGEIPQIVIASAATADDIFFNSVYRGQSFALEFQRIWLGQAPPNLPRWFAFRDVPTAPNQIILWARADLTNSGN